MYDQKRGPCWWLTVSVLLVMLAAGCLADIGEECEIDSDCAGDLICHQGSHTCMDPNVECNIDDHCSGNKGVCNTQGQCVVCTVDEEGTHGCEEDDQDGPHCRDESECVECLEDGDCPEGKGCEENKCA